MGSFRIFLEANGLQSVQPLDPFDCIGLGIILVKSAMRIKIIKTSDVPRGKLFEVKVNEKVVRVVLTWHALDGANDYNISANEFRGGIYEDKILP